MTRVQDPETLPVDLDAQARALKVLLFEFDEAARAHLVANDDESSRTHQLAWEYRQEARPLMETMSKLVDGQGGWWL